jgi:hypothetical protein
VGSRVVLDAVVKRKIPSPHRESKPRTPIAVVKRKIPSSLPGIEPPIIQPAAQRYTIELSQLFVVV